jgi:5-methylcytosine-specific restriction endonuclease McrA
MEYFGNACWMCGGAFDEVDHVKPLSKGGIHALSNMRPSCDHCNNTKHARWYGPNHLDRFVKA